MKPLRNPSEGQASALLFFVVLGIYLLWPTKDFYWDGVSFAIDIEKAARFATPLFHPNHLIYNFAGFWLFEWVRAVRPEARALFVLQTLNSALAAASAALVYRIVRREGADGPAAAGWALLFAFSATWWKFAADADAYIASIFLLLCCYSALTAAHPRPLTAAALHALAMLFHELAALFFPAAVFLLWRKRGARAALVYAAAAFLPTISAYGLAYRYGLRSGPPVGFADWITAHSPDARWTFSIPRGLGLFALGNPRLFFGGKLSGWNLDWVTRLGAALAIVTLLVALRRGRIGWRRTTAGNAPLWIWIGAYSIFLLFFQPQNTFYRLFYLPAIVFLLASRLRGAIGWAAAIVLLWNFTFLMYPRSKVESNETLAFALRERARWPAGSGIVYHVFHPDLWTIAYFNWQASWIGLETADIPRLESLRADFAGGGRALWIEQTTLELLGSSGEGKRWLAAHVERPAAIRHQSGKRSFAFYRVE